MTFDGRETSYNEGQPVGLLFFAIGGWSLRVAACDTPQVFNGHTWASSGIELPRIVQSGEIRKNDLTIKVPFDFPISAMWINGPPAGKVLCILYDAHIGEAETRESWTGHVANVSWPSPAVAEITISSGAGAMKTQGLRLVAQRSCTSGIYTPRCGVSLGALATVGECTDVGGNWVEAAEFGALEDGWFNGGVLRYTDPTGIPDFRHIRNHVGTRLTLAWAAGRVAEGMELTADPGCDETPNHCGPKFDNEVNYGGLPHFKTKNPFGGDPIY